MDEDKPKSNVVVSWVIRCTLGDDREVDISDLPDGTAQGVDDHIAELERENHFEKQ